MRFLRPFKRLFSHRDHIHLFKNTSALSLVQLSNYILPLITIPYLSRTLGPNYFGLVLMAQSTMTYLSQITDYGFNLFAIKDIAKYRDTPGRVSAIVSDVLWSKLILLLLSGLILTALIQIIPIFSDHWLLFGGSFLIVIGNTWFPSFVFQGLEKMGLIATLNVGAKTLFTGLIFYLIQTPSDYVWVHAIWGCSYILVDIMAMIIIRKKCNIRFLAPKISSIFNTLCQSFEYFLSRIALVIYLNTNIIIIGIILSPSDAGIYGGAEKLLFALTTLYTPIIESVYPYVSRTKNTRLIFKIIGLVAIINTVACLMAVWLAPIIVPLILGPNFQASIGLFRLMIVIAWLHVPISMIGYPVLGAMGHEKYANRSVIAGAISHIMGMAIAYPFLTSPYTFILITIVSQLVIMGIRIYGLIHTRLYKTV